MLKPKYYHGLSQEEWEQTKKQNGFDLREDLGRYLAMSGVYLFRNNPLLAYRWALRKQTQREDSPSGTIGQPVVLEVELDENVDPTKILDLTTDEGMQALFIAHRQFGRLFDGELSKALRAMEKNPSRHVAEYRKSTAEHFVRKRLESVGYLPTQIDGILAAYHGTFKLTGRVQYEDINFILAQLIEAPESGQPNEQFNYDCAAISILVDQHRYAVVIAAIQEASTLNAYWHGHTYKCDTTEGYEGIRVLDHLELCITDASIIKWPPKVCTFDIRNYDKYYWAAAIAYRRYTRDK